MRKNLGVLLALLSLSACSALPKPQPQRLPPASCIEPAPPLPDPKADLMLYTEELILNLTELSVLRNQCRGALLPKEK